MARIAKPGLEYFPFDVDLFQDFRIRKLIKRQGGKAVTVYALLLCLIYKNGYYVQWDEELPFICSESTGFDEAYILEVIRACLALGLFDKDMYACERVLTSRSIQTRYCSIQRMSKRMARISKYSLLDDKKPSPVPGTTASSASEPKEVIGSQGADTPTESPVSCPREAIPASPAPPSALGNNSEWMAEFFADNNKENLLLLCKSLGFEQGNIPGLRLLAEAVVNEWELSRTPHFGYSDWSRHLISAMRRKYRDPSTKQNITSPPAPADYTFGGGFGGQDI